jgi:hypothetical protein
MSKQIIPAIRIAQSIYFLRGQKVILDSDLAALYGVTTGNLNKAVSRNRDRFPSDFVFQITAEEARRLRCQVGTSGSSLMFQFGRSKGSGGEHRDHARIRKPARDAGTNRELARKFAELEKRVGKHDAQIDAILEAIRQLMIPPEKPRREIGFHVREKAPRYRTRHRR